MRLVAASTAIAATTVVMLFGAATTAHAANGVVDAQNKAGFTQYIDSGDKVKVCDTKKNGDGVLGWISVRQTNGKFKDHPRIYVGGAGKCVTRAKDVTPENTSIILTACSVSGPKGTPYSCNSKIIKGS
ncbi:hypothetical protein [Kribbella sp. CA-293567]|uniref:hypothetical protein n=1 Tax=Kribbella sp. CA-293567 TaxID=3002436 RepID=UPI0022DD4824|nr:hypothetical protein [Kribbella sp. CA-293567]WBQ05251.1 hypothetical protein OX958_00280 [Kribbella sp. CA-293567]